MATTTTTRLGLRKQALGDNPGAWHTDLNAGFDDADARLFQSGAGDPSALTAHFVGQQYFDTTAEEWWTATDTAGPSTWVRSDRPIVSAEGSIIVGDASGLPIELLIGTSGYFLRVSSGGGGVTPIWEPLLEADLPLRAGYAALSGLKLSVNGTDAHDLDIGKGFARDAADSLTLVQPLAPLIKQIDATFASGINAGGMNATDHPAVADTWYHVFLIRKTSDESIDVYFDTSVSATNIPPGHDSPRRIGSVKTESASTLIKPFAQFGDRFIWTTPILDADSSSVGTSDLALVLPGVPPGIITHARMNAYMQDNAQSGVRLRDSTQADLAVSSSAAPLGNLMNPDSVSGRANMGQIEAFTDTSQQVNIRASAAISTVRLSVQSYLDLRGKE